MVRRLAWGLSGKKRTVDPQRTNQRGDTLVCCVVAARSADPPKNVRSAYRGSNLPAYRHEDVGFRAMRIAIP